MSTNVKLLRLSVLAIIVGVLYFSLRAPDAAPPAARAEPDYFSFVRSQQGTKPDGELHQNGAEQLVVDAELGHLFDYYLAGLGEQTLEAIRAEIVRELDRRLKPPAAAQARRLLDRYLDYKRALADVEKGLPKTGNQTQGARQRLAAMQQLRQTYFNPEEIDGLFGASDAYDADALARLEITTDATLTAAQRQERLAALDAKLPPALREERAAPARVVKLEEAVAQRRAQGAGDNEIYQLRAAALSPEAAARLADVDREEADWKQRITAYQSQRAQLLAKSAGTAELQQLRDAGFSPLEQKRLGAYE